MDPFVLVCRYRSLQLPSMTHGGGKLLEQSILQASCRQRTHSSTQCLRRRRQGIAGSLPSPWIWAQYVQTSGMESTPPLGRLGAIWRWCAHTLLFKMHCCHDQYHCYCRSLASTYRHIFMIVKDLRLCMGVCTSKRHTGKQKRALDTPCKCV